MTDISRFLSNPENNSQGVKKYVIPRLGEDYPISIKNISDTEYQNALDEADKARKKNVIGASSLFVKRVCLLGMVDPNLNSTELIEIANANVQKANTKIMKDIEDEYKKEKSEWEKAGSDPNSEPVKKKAILLKNVLTPKDLLENWFLPGEIIQIGEKILDISGFGITLVEATEKAKN